MPQGQIWRKQPACTPPRTSTGTGKSRWKNSWAVRRPRWLQPFRVRFGWPLFGLLLPSKAQRRNLPHLLQPCPKPSLGPCSLNRSVEVGRANNATCLDSNSKDGANSLSKAGLNNPSKAGSNPNRCTTSHRPSPRACDAQVVGSASMDNGGSVLCVAPATPRCRTEASILSELSVLEQRFVVQPN